MSPSSPLNEVEMAQPHEPAPENQESEQEQDADMENPIEEGEPMHIDSEGDGDAQMRDGSPKEPDSDNDSNYDYGPPPDEDEEETRLFNNALKFASVNNAPSLEEAVINTGEQNELLSMPVPNEKCGSPTSLCPYLGISIQEFKMATRSLMFTEILTKFNSVDYFRYRTSHAQWSSIAKAIKEMSSSDSRKYLKPTISDLGSFDMYKLYAWAIIALHRECYTNDRALFANRGVPHDMEYPKVYAVLKYFKKLYREKKKTESNKVNVEHEKSKSRPIEAAKQNPKKDRTPKPSARERMKEILEIRRDRSEVALLADLERRAIIESGTHADLAKKIKTKKDLKKEAEAAELADKKINEALEEYHMLQEQRETLESGFDENDDAETRLDALNDLREKEEEALDGLHKLKDEGDAAAVGKLEALLFLELESVNRHGVIEKSSKRTVGTFDEHKTPKHTTDSRNPRATWFKDGRLIGGNGTYSLLDYTGVDWVDGDRLGPNPNPGRADVVSDVTNKPSAPKLTAKRPKSRATTPLQATVEDEVMEEAQSVSNVTNKPSTPDVTAKRPKSRATTPLQATVEDEVIDETQAIDEDLAEMEMVREERRQERLARAKAIYAATWFNHGDATKDSDNVATEEPLSRSEFAKVLLSGAHLEAATLVPEEKENPEHTETEDGITKPVKFTDPLSQRFVEQEEWAGKVARGSAMVPNNLRKAFTTLRVKHRSLPNIPNQDGRPPLPWQSLGAAEGVERQLRWTINDRIEEATDYSVDEEEASEAGEALSKEQDPEQAKRRKSEKRREARRRKRATRSAQSDEPRGMLYADVVGIGKTDTVLLKRIAICNERDIKLQKLRDAEDWDGLAAFPPPRPLFFITQPHLVQQAAMDAAAISSKNRVYIYGRDPEIKDKPANIGIISESLTRQHKIFSAEDPTNSRVIVVVSYNRLLTRNGQIALDAWLKKTEPSADKEMRDKALAKGLPLEWPGNLANLVDSIILDECQATKGLGSKSTTAIEYLNSDWCDLVSATPIPWKFQDFGGLLNFIQNPRVNRQAKTMIDEGRLPDPYVTDPITGLLVRPELEKFCYTLSAFQKFICQGNIDLTEVGSRIGMIWQKVMIRREYSNSYVIDHKGTRHTIGDAMPVARSVRLHLTNTKKAQEAYLDAVQAQIGNMVVPDEKNENIVRLNGRMVRQLNLFSIHPHMKYAHSILNVKVCHQNDIGKPEDEQRMIPNPDLEEFTRLYNEREDTKFLRKLMVEMKKNSKAEGKLLKHWPKFNPVLPKEEDPTAGSVLATTFVRDSIRFRALIANLTDQVVVGEKKALIYCQHPFEQQLLTVILRLLTFKAEALLATHAATAKSELIPRFNARLSKHCAPGSAGFSDFDYDLEILVLSYYMNSGLNLQYQCPFLHAFSPPISESVWQQTCGRIVRFGQPSECLVLEYFVTGTFNQKQIATATNNAFVSHAALMLGGIAPLTIKENENDMGYQSKMADLLCWVLFGGKMYDVRDPSTPEAIRKMPKLSLNNVILHKLQSKGPMDVKVTISDKTASGNENIESVKIADQPMFHNFEELTSTSTKTKKTGTTPSKPRFIASPVSHQNNLKSIMDLKNVKAGKRKAASSSKAGTPTKRTRTNRTVGKQLVNIDEAESDADMLDSSPLTRHGKNDHEATREQIDAAIGEARKPNPLGDFAYLPSDTLDAGPESDLSELQIEEDNTSTAAPKPKRKLKLTLKNTPRVQQPVFDLKKQGLIGRDDTSAPKQRKRDRSEDSIVKTTKKSKTSTNSSEQKRTMAPSRASTRQAKKQLSNEIVTGSDMEEDTQE